MKPGGNCPDRGSAASVPHFPLSGTSMFVAVARSERAVDGCTRTSNLMSKRKPLGIRDGTEMPIFERSGRRVYFAHIPKSGGTSIYSAFVGSGWTVKNLSEWRDRRSAFSRLQERYGIERIEHEGRMFKYPYPPQHAPYIIWRTWGPFETSFAISREPVARLLSALKYHYRMRREDRPFADFAEAILGQAFSRPWAHLFMLGGHLIPQHRFVGQRTEVFRFEDNWGQQLSARFGVSMPPLDNRSSSTTGSIPDKWLPAVRQLYKRDFERFGY